MTPSNLQDQLTKYLTDAHSIEEQALVQLRMAPRLAGDAQIAGHFSQHLTETKEQERLVRQRLQDRGASPSRIKDMAGMATGVGFALFAKLNPDTPGKLVNHAFSYEHMELAAYDLLARVADRAGDAETARVAREIEAQESAMADRLAGSFDLAVQASLRDLSPSDIDEQLGKYLADAHALEAQAVQLLEKGPKLAGTPELASAYQDHLAVTHEHQRLVDGRLKAKHSRPSRFKDAALRLGALNWGTFFAAQPDTPAKLAAFAYAFEHLEVGAYELLARVANRAGDTETEALAQRILADEHAAADRIRSLFDQALDASLEAQGVGAR